ncbi:MAG TPA: UdgX family uracil-DNA binding protein [Polyangia bacterium]|jgi:DNA polymerase|nr:UdgX family uracil-DNA binding protein [Polyangia bacterium]
MSPRLLRIEPAHPPTTSLQAAAAACRGCHACPLYLHATQAVFGEGPPHASLMLVGEQPGDEEDRRGHPFVGPAGGLLERALTGAGIPRDDVYVTNAVKHFKWKPNETGKRRLHDKPKGNEIRACRPWLLDELGLVQPHVVVAMGATAASSLFGTRAQVMRDHGHVLTLAVEEGGPVVKAVLTIHPSAALRAPTPEGRHELLEMLVGDLRVARAAI